MRPIDQAPVRGNLVPDAHVATILFQHGVATMYSNDHDFTKFPSIELRDPFVFPRACSVETSRASQLSCNHDPNLGHRRLLTARHRPPRQDQTGAADRDRGACGHRHSRGLRLHADAGALLPLGPRCRLSCLCADPVRHARRRQHRDRQADPHPVAVRVARVHDAEIEQIQSRDGMVARAGAPGPSGVRQQRRRRHRHVRDRRLCAVDGAGRERARLGAGATRAAGHDARGARYLACRPRAGEGAHRQMDSSCAAIALQAIRCAGRRGSRPCATRSALPSPAPNCPTALATLPAS